MNAKWVPERLEYGPTTWNIAAILLLLPESRRRRGIRSNVSTWLGEKRDYNPEEKAVGHLCPSGRGWVVGEAITTEFWKSNRKYQWINEEKNNKKRCDQRVPVPSNLNIQWRNGRIMWTLIYQVNNRKPWKIELLSVYNHRVIKSFIVEI